MPWSQGDLATASPVKDWPRGPSGYRIATHAVVTYFSVALGRFVEWAPPDRILEFVGLIVATILTSTAARQRTRTSDWAIVPPSFVIEFASLLLLGPDATLLIVAAATVTQMRAQPLRRTLSTAVTLMLAVEAAGFALRVFRWHNGGIRLAVARRADRGRGHRVLHRQERVGGDRRAALRETADQPIVAAKRAQRLSELLHRRQRRSGTRRTDRSPAVDSRPGGRRAAVLRATAPTAPT